MRAAAMAHQRVGCREWKATLIHKSLVCESLIVKLSHYFCFKAHSLFEELAHSGPYHTATERVPETGRWSGLKEAESQMPTKWKNFSRCLFGRQAAGIESAISNPPAVWSRDEKCLLELIKKKGEVGGGGGGCYDWKSAVMRLWQRGIRIWSGPWAAHRWETQGSKYSKEQEALECKIYSDACDFVLDCDWLTL